MKRKPHNPLSFMDFLASQKYTYVFVNLRWRRHSFATMDKRICHACEAVYSSISDSCPSCGTCFVSKPLTKHNPLPFIAAACASFLMFGVVLGVAS